MEHPEQRAPDILLVDDSDADSRMVGLALAELGTPARLRRAASVDGALAMLRDPSGDEPIPDLVLLDLNLTAGDGRELLRELRSDAALAHIPVLVLSTSNREADILDCYRSHCNAFLCKPEQLEEFIRLLHCLLEFWFSTARLPRTNSHADVPSNG